MPGRPNVWCSRVLDEALAGILDVLLQGGQARAAAEAPGGFGRGWEPGLPGGKSLSPLSAVALARSLSSASFFWAGAETKNVCPEASSGLILQVSAIPRTFAQTSMGEATLHVIPQQIPTCAINVMGLFWFYK